MKTCHKSIIRGQATEEVLANAAADRRREKEGRENAIRAHKADIAEFERLTGRKILSPYTTDGLSH